jgi:NB-ARC domain/Effector-associated domain 8/APAF-1 helical domain
MNIRAQLVNTLSSLPGFQTSRSRQALLNTRLSLSDLRRRINWEGSPYEFADNLLSLIAQRGRKDLEVLLEELQSSDVVGVDGRQQLARLQSDIARVDEKQWSDQFERPAIQELFIVPKLPHDFVMRPTEFEQLKRIVLTNSHPQGAAITIAVHGTGGFGKSVLVAALCCDLQVKAAFADGVLWTTLGEQPTDLVKRVNDWIYVLSNESPNFATEEAASARLSQLLNDRRVLLVIDDVWNGTHLHPFLVGGRHCVQLIITRNREVLPPGTHAVVVGTMQPDEAGALLCAELPQPAPLELGRLIARLGGWPLLLSLVNRNIRELVIEERQSLAKAVRWVEDALSKRGVVAFDLNKPADRNEAVALTLEASLKRLEPEERDRFTELAIFHEDSHIPLSAVEQLWNSVSRMDAFEVKELCRRLRRLSLLEHLDLETGVIRLHDVVRDYAMRQLSNPKELHERLVHAWGDLYVLPDVYAWRHLAYHLVESGQIGVLRRLLLDFTWIEAKLEITGPSALIADYDYLSDDAVVRKVRSTVWLAHTS